MDDRYPVAFGYADDSTPSGMKATPRLRGNLSTEHFRKWAELMAELSQIDVAALKAVQDQATATIPPGSYMPAMFDVVISQHVDTADWVTVRATCAFQSVVRLADFLVHWNDVEDELEAEQESAHP